MQKNLSKQIVRIRFWYLQKRLETQKMGLPLDTLQVPAAPFTNIGIDLLGPLVVKSMVDKRATMKICVVLFVCLNVKAVLMELSPGCFTAHFLLVYDAHVNQWGLLSYVHFDRGSQLVSTHKEVISEQQLWLGSDIYINSCSRHYVALNPFWWAIAKWLHWGIC